MTFSRKIFIAVVLTSLIAGSLILWTTYRYVSEQSRTVFLERYSVLSKVLGDTLTRLDISTESLMMNAAQVVKAYDSQKGILSTEELKRLRDTLGVTHIFVVDRSGKFVRSTNEDVSLIPNAFSFCPAYKKMVTGQNSMDATPIVHPRPEPKPYKFLFIPNRNRKRLLEIGVRVDFLGRTLNEALNSDKNVLSLSVFDPQGTSFGTFTAKEYKFDESKIKLPENISAAVDNGDVFKFYTKVKSSHPICCQCEISGTSKNGEYYYVLESVVSKAEFTAALAKTKVMFILFGFIIILMSLIFGRFLVRRLVRNIESAAERVRQIKMEGTFQSRIKLEGDDEVTFLTNEFDALLDSLEETKIRAVEAEKIQAKVQLATEVAHNIKSPIIAIEMMLPMLVRLPEKIQAVFKNSVREIKTLAESLKKHADTLAVQSIQENELIFLPVFLQDFVTQKNFEFSSRPSVEVIFDSHCTDANAFVKLTSVELRSLLSNLVNNAVDSYGGNSGKVRVELDSSLFRCLIRVVDYGAGIPAEYLKDLGSRRITFKGGGTRGVGLLQAFKLVNAWDGKISIQSEIGKGTTVEIAFAKYQQHSDVDTGKLNA